MATKKKAPPSKRSSADRSFAIPGLDMKEISKLTLMDGLSEDESSDDGEMEAELEAILSGKTSGVKKQKKQREAVDMNSLQTMVDECMKSDESDGNDENLSGDEDLEAELSRMVTDSPPPQSSRRSAPPPPPPATVTKPVRRDSPDNTQIEPGNILETLQSRKTDYKKAEDAAKSIGDNTKARRYGRAVKTLETLIRECSAGRQINPDDIPPPVVTRIEKPTAAQIEERTEGADEPKAEPTGSSSPPKTQPQRTVTPSRSPNEQPIPNRRVSLKEVKTESKHNMLVERRDQYKIAALNAKRSGDNATALKYVKTAKQFDIVIDALAKGQQIDYSKMPPPPPRELLRQQSVTTNAPEIPPPIPEKSSRPSVQPGNSDKPMQNLIENFEGNEEDAQKFFNAPDAPKTILQALQQRLEKYQSTQKAALAESNSSKAKRLGRIVKQYEDAIKNFKAGRPVDFESLPSPPGFGEIPGVSQGQAAPSEPPPVPPHRPVAQSQPNRPQTTPTRPQPAKTADGRQQKTPPNLAAQQAVQSTSLLDKQLSFLAERHRLFREAALEAKKSGDLEHAKEYLRMSKGLEPMMEATRSGLPIDASTIPTPPQLQKDFVVVEKSECLEDDWIGDKDEMFRTLERDLLKQIDICLKNRNHFQKQGDIASAEKFENYGKHTKQDLNVVQNMWKKDETVPKFHYEDRLFKMVQCNSELGDNEVEVSIVRGINLPGKPKDLDSYVKIEFPFPNEAPQCNKTHTVKDTNVPEYNATFKFEINRKSKALARALKRHNLKLEVWSKGGLFRSDTLLGTAQVKLSDFDTKCTIHDSFDLFNGRKQCGGKLEVKACIRDPLLAKQIEEVRERWLIIGS